MTIKLFKPQVIEYETTDILQTQMIQYTEDRINHYQNENGTCRLLLSGGKTPMEFYKKLGQNQATIWEEVELYQTDERYVINNQLSSNQYNISNSFGCLTMARIKSANFFNTTLELGDCVENYNEIIDSLETPFFDIAVIGIGVDGHIASLFPNGPYLKHLDDFALATVAPASLDTPIQRLSVSIETLLNAQEIFVVLLGYDKSAVLTELLEGTKSATEFPAKFLLSHPRLKIYSCFA
jgi:6-phosphogluconolactonase